MVHEGVLLLFCGLYSEANVVPAGQKKNSYAYSALRLYPPTQNPTTTSLQLNPGTEMDLTGVIYFESTQNNAQH